MDAADTVASAQRSANAEGGDLSIYRSAEFRTAVAALRTFCASHGMAPSCIILTGYPKSGNTLARFVYHNLINVRNGGATQTLTYTQLNAANPNQGFPDELATVGFREPSGIDHRGFPLMLHGHQAWSGEWREIGSTLLVHRDPLDSLIGSWYANVDFPAHLTEREDIDTFVLRNLPAWVALYARTVEAADVVLTYEAMTRNPHAAFGDAFARLGVRCTAAELARAVDMSTFDRIREMEDRYGQRHGHRSNPEHNRRFGLAPWRDDDNVRFTRSGKSGQWRWELKPDTVARARDMLASHGLGTLL
jgi:hypothetical protein